MKNRSHSAADALGWFGSVSRWLLPMLTVACAALFGLRRLSDPDTWWHLASGRWIALHWAVPHTDTLSFTVPSHAWINLQWLFDLCLYALHRVGGDSLLVVVSALAYGLAAALLFRNLRVALGSVGACLLTLWVTAIAWERFAVRPEMVTFVLLEAVLWLFATRRFRDGRRLWLLVPVMALWVNTHALFVIGAFVIVCHMAALGVVRLPFVPVGWRTASTVSPATARRVLRAGTIAVLVTLVNPYGVRGSLFPFTLFSRVNGSNPVFQRIGEFAPPFSSYFPELIASAYQLFFIFGITVVALAGLLTALPTRRTVHAADADARFDIGDLLVFCGLAYLSVLARRNMALFAFGAAPFVAQCLVILKRKSPPVWQRTWRMAAHTLAVLLPPLLIAMGWFLATNGFYRWDIDTQEFGTGVLDIDFPIRASAFMKEMRVPTRVFNDLTCGGYLGWDRPVDGGVYIDGRLEVYDTAFFSSYTAALTDPSVWQREAEREGINTVVLFHRWANRHRLIRWLLSSPQWALVYYDEVAVVFVRRAGNEQLVAEAQRRFQSVHAATERRLLGPVSSWQWPIARMEALSTYAQLLNLIGKARESVRFYDRMLALGLPPAQEVAMRIALATYLARQGDLAAARLHLARAAQADPYNPQVLALQRRLGG